MHLSHARSFCALAVLLAVSLCAGDTLTTRDGRKYTGLVISRDKAAVVFEVHKYGATMRIKFALAEVASVRESPLPADTARIAEPDPQPSAQETASLPELPALEPAPPIAQVSGPTFCVIPMRGVVGKDIVAPVLEAALADAVKRKPTVIILEMDSPGGLIREVEPLIGTIRKYHEARIVLVVHHAISAAAITGLSVPEIYMTSNSIFGAATAFRVMPDGTPLEIEEKMRSVWRAVARNSAEQGGHSPLLAMAMIDAKYDLRVETGSDGKKTIVEGDGGDMVVSRGNLLAMTAPEGKACGLSAGTIDDFATLGKLLHMAKWTRIDCHAPALMEHWQKSIAQAQKEFDRLDKEAAKNMEQARASDPSQFTYKGYPNGTLTPESQQQWNDRAEACTKSLAAAEETLDKMSALTEKFPQLLADADAIKKQKTQIDAVKTNIQKRQKK
jgi:hypothetical protein